MFDKRLVLRRMLASQNVIPTNPQEENKDPICQIIIDSLDEAENENDVYNQLDYAISQLVRAQRTLNDSEDDTRVGIYSQDGYELSDGGVIEYPDDDWTIRRKDVHGNSEEVCNPGDAEYADWLELFADTLFSGGEYEEMRESGLTHFPTGEIPAEAIQLQKVYKS